MATLSEKQEELANQSQELEREKADRKEALSKAHHKQRELEKVLTA